MRRELPPISVARRRWLAAGLAITWNLEARAQAKFPARPLRMIVPFTPAGATDILARLMAESLGRQLGAGVVIDNRPGAGGNLGGELVARAPADGYTILMAPITVYAAGSTLMPSRAFDLQRDFTPLCTAAYVPHVLVVPATLGVSTVRALIALARSKPGTLNLASQGIGTISHLEAELFQTMTAAKLTHVPYKGSAPALLDLVGGRMDVMFDSVAAALPHIQSGRLRALGVTTPTRSRALPDVPTIAEAGVVGYVSESWVAVLAPAKLPQPIADRLTDALKAVVDDPAFAARTQQHGLEARSRVRSDLVALIQRETALWGRVVRDSGVRLE